MVNRDVYRELMERYVSHYGREPEVVAYAPGRVEVLGNHTDYNEGLVLSAAINYGTFFAAARSSDSRCRLVAGDLMREVSFDASEVVPSSSDTWQNYVKGTYAGVVGHQGVLFGFDGMFLGNVPVGSGLSSSAALEMSTALAIGKLYGVELDLLSMAKIGQRAEHEYAGCKCGLLDQISSLAGEEGMLVRTDFRTMEYELVGIGDEVCFLMCNTHARHSLADGAYNKLREACEEAARYFDSVLTQPVRALRDVSMREWAIYRHGLPSEVADCAAHPIGESERVVEGTALLESGDLAGFGKLMFDSHASSRLLFKNSCPELDFIVKQAGKTPGVLGARLSGGGFGGSVVALVRPESVAAISEQLTAAYRGEFGRSCDISVIEPAAGARLV